MVLQTMLFAPLRFATGPLEIMALLRLDYTTVTLRQGLKTGITKALGEAFAGLAPASDTVNFTCVG